MPHFVAWLVGILQFKVLYKQNTVKLPYDLQNCPREGVNLTRDVVICQMTHNRLCKLLWMVLAVIFRIHAHRHRSWFIPRTWFFLTLRLVSAFAETVIHHRGVFPEFFEKDQNGL